MKITGSVVTYNNIKTIERCLRSILEETKKAGLDFTLYCYDNGSTDGTPELVKRLFPEVILVEDSVNRGFGAGHNALIKRVKSDYHFVINPDIFIDEDTIGRMSDYLGTHPEAGLVTPKILNRDGTEQYLPKYCPTIRYVFISRIPGFGYLRRKYTRADEDIKDPEEIEFCTGCFFGVRTSYIKAMKGFSNRYFMYCEDTDLSRRVRADGKKIIFYPEVSVYHDWHRENTGNLRGIIRFLRSLSVYFSKWGLEF